MTEPVQKPYLAEVVESIRANDAFVLKTAHLASKIVALLDNYALELVETVRGEPGFDEADVKFALSTTPLTGLLALAAATEIIRDALSVEQVQGVLAFEADAAALKTAFEDLEYIGEEHALRMRVVPVYEAIVRALNSKRAAALEKVPG